MIPLCDPRSQFVMRELSSDDEGQPVAYGERTGSVSSMEGCSKRYVAPKPYGVEIDPRALKPERTTE